ncbi:MAG: transketolase [Ferruginibacter sp.]|nr:transketolase [Ferruginibacter sp.]
MRTAFISHLVERARVNPKIFLVVGDLGYSVVEPFANLFPDRFLNAGIAEQNMTGIAAGLAMEGYTVFTYSIANFPTLRCMEQIRYDICYHNLDVKIVSVGGGYAYGSLGASHHATEDIGMMRTIPNLIVSAPGDPVETRAVLDSLLSTSSPAYLRLGKAGEPVIHANEIILPVGKSVRVLSGRNTAVLTTGAMLQHSLTTIQKNNYDFSLYSFPFVKPLDLERLAEISSNYSTVITIEEHQKSGGFGSAILEGFNDLLEAGVISKLPTVRRIATPDIFTYTAGSQEYLRKTLDLTF